MPFCSIRRVHPDFQRQGIATSLVRRAAELARERGAAVAGGRFRAASRRLLPRLRLSPNRGGAHSAQMKKAGPARTRQSVRKPGAGGQARSGAWDNPYGLSQWDALAARRSVRTRAAREGSADMASNRSERLMPRSSRRRVVERQEIVKCLPSGIGCAHFANESNGVAERVERDRGGRRPLARKQERHFSVSKSVLCRSRKTTGCRNGVIAVVIQIWAGHLFV